MTLLKKTTDFSDDLDLLRVFHLKFTINANVVYIQVEGTFSTSILCPITGSAVALHCCKAHERINRKTGNSTPCKIVTPENFSSKVCTRDYVGDGNYCANFCENRFSGGVSPNR